MRHLESFRLMLFYYTSRMLVWAGGWTKWEIFILIFYYSNSFLINRLNVESLKLINLFHVYSVLRTMIYAQQYVCNAQGYLGIMYMNTYLTPKFDQLQLHLKYLYAYLSLMDYSSNRQVVWQHLTKCCAVCSERERERNQPIIQTRET